MVTLDLIRHGDKLGDPNFRSSQGKDQFERKKERKKESKKEMKVEKKNQKRNTHLFFSSINSVHVSRNYGNKLMKKLIAFLCFMSTRNTRLIHALRAYNISN